MVDDVQQRSVRATDPAQVDRLGRLGSWSSALVMLLMSSGLLTNGVGAAERDRPFLIGALTAS